VRTRYAVDLISSIPGFAPFVIVRIEKWLEYSVFT